MNNNVKLFICTHNAAIETTNSQFEPLQVGKASSGIELGITADNTGDNISKLNPYYCELTGLYWMWKNASQYDAEYIGLCHYRRYFNYGESFANGETEIQTALGLTLDSKKVSKIFSKYDIVLVKPMRLPHSLTVHYAINHNSEDYRTLKKVISDLYPEYMSSFIRTMEYGNKISYYNMFISDKQFLDDYCTWLFKVLKEVEARVDIAGYNQRQARIYGFMSERLLNVYVNHHKLKVKYMPLLTVGIPNKHIGFKLKLVKLWANTVFFFNSLDRKLRVKFDKNLNE